jgi:hypothetical protein
MPVGRSAAMDDLVRTPIAGEASALAASSRALEVAWIGSLIGAAAMLLLMAAGHRPIGRAWPPSQRVYAVMFPS